MDLHLKMKWAVGLVLMLLLGLGCACPVLAEAYPAQGIYEIRSAANEAYVLDEKHCTERDVSFSDAQLYSPMQVKQQEFYLELVSARTCRIISLESGRYLTEGEIKTKTSASGEKERRSGDVLFAQRMERSQQGATDQQLWRLVTPGDAPAKSETGASFLLQSASGLYLSLADGRACKGAALALREKSGRQSQRWVFTPAPIYASGTADTDVVNPYLEGGALADVKVSVRFFDSTEVLTAETLAGWMTAQDEHTLSFDEEKLRAFVEGLAQKYNTVGKPRTFITSYKTPLTLYKGNFGWKLDEEATFATLQSALAQPGHRTVVPTWSQRAGDLQGKNGDIGDSYVEVDLKAQKVWLYKDGKQLLETDCVSGTLGTDRETPGGVYFIFYKQAPAVLNGPGYSSPVNFWMPYNGGIGLHDAPWRSEFGGEIYKTNGSHGCINLPYEAAELIYQTVEIGYPVVSYG